MFSPGSSSPALAGIFVGITHRGLFNIWTPYIPTHTSWGCLCQAYMAEGVSGDEQIEKRLPELLLARMLSHCCRTRWCLLTSCHTGTQTLLRQKFSAQLTILSSRCCWRLQNTFKQGPAGQLLGWWQTPGAPLSQISKDRVPEYIFIHETFQCYKVVQAVTLKSYLEYTSSAYLHF